MKKKTEVPELTQDETAALFLRQLFGPTRAELVEAARNQK